MFDDVVHYLADNKVVLLAAATTVAELLVIIANLLRRLDDVYRRVGLKMHMPDLTIPKMAVPFKRSRVLFWSAWPPNLFREISHS